MNVPDNTDPVAHMIDVEPPAMLGCSATELKYAGAISILGWFAAGFLILLLLFGLSSWLWLTPLIGFWFGFVTARFIASWIGRQKQGKPHLYYIHKIEVDLLSRFRRRSPYVLHTGVFALGRTRKG